MSTPRGSTPRRSGRKHFQSPKKARKKRTPRCDGCGKKDGDDVSEGAPPGATVKLKICARCRGVAYCSATCQRAKWVTHRDRCVQVEPPAAAAAARPPVSPSSSTRSHRQNKILSGPGTSRGARRKPSGSLGMTATPRNRERAPTKHPFFGNQHETPSRGVSPMATQVAPILSSRRRGQQYIQQQIPEPQEYQPSQQRPGSEESGTSPPRMHRLSVAGAHPFGADNRKGNNPVKIMRVSSTSRLESQYHRRRTAGGATGSPPPGFAVQASADQSELFGFDFRTYSSPRDRILRGPASARERMQGLRKASPPPRSATRRHTYGPDGFLPRGDPPPLPPRQTTNDINDGGSRDSNRRLSAPVFPESFEEKHRVRVKGFAATTAGEAGRRGPPPPYSSVAHRAHSMGSGGRSPSMNVFASRMGQPAVAVDGVGAGEAIIAPPSTSQRSIPPPTVSPIKSSNGGAREAPRDVVTGETSDRGASGAEQAANRRERDFDSDGEQKRQLDASRLKDELKKIKVKEKSRGAAAAAAAAAAALASLEEAKLGTGAAGGGEVEGTPKKASPLKQGDEAESASATGAMTLMAPSPCGDETKEGFAVIDLAPTGNETAETPPPAGPSPTGNAAVQGRHSAPPGPPPFSSPSAISTGHAKGFTRNSTSSRQSPLPEGGSPGGSGRRFSPRPRPPVSPGPALSPSSCPPKPPSVLPEVSMQDTESASPSTSSRGEAGTPLSTKTTTKPMETIAGNEEVVKALARATTSPGKLQPGVRGPTANGSVLSPAALPFVPVVEFSPKKKPPTPHNPGPRRTETATFYQRRLGRFRGSGLPPASNTYLGRPAGFSVHVLVSSAPTSVDLTASPDSPVVGGGKPAGNGAAATGTPTAVKSVPPALKAARAERAFRYASGNAQPWVFYSTEERGRVARSLRAGDVILLTPGRYEARAWGLQHLVSSVEIIGVGAAKACVLYNDPPPDRGAYLDNSHAEHYLIGVMGDPAAGGSSGNGGGAPGGHRYSTGLDADDDSDSGWEDGSFGAATAVEPAPAADESGSDGRAVRVRLANLTLEQGSGYRGALYQLGRESHLELDGCVVRCSQGGLNIDQGTCLICDCTIEGSEAFGVHIGGEGAVEHCCIRDCGRGGGAGGQLRRSSRSSSVSPMRRKGPSLDNANAENGEDDADDGTNVNRDVGMPAISVLQSSRVRVRFNVIRENFGHALQCRDAPLPGGEDKRAMLVRRAQVEAEEQLRSWLGHAAVLLRDHLADQRRQGSLVAEGNLCQRNRGCKAGSCAGGTDRYSVGSNGSNADLTKPKSGTSSSGVGRLSQVSDSDGHKVSELGSGGVGGNGRSSMMWNSDAPICIRTGEQEGLPLPAAMTLRFLSAMDEGYVGSMREENARLRKQRGRAG